MVTSPRLYDTFFSSSLCFLFSYFLLKISLICTIFLYFFFLLSSLSFSLSFLSSFSFPPPSPHIFSPSSLAFLSPSPCSPYLLSSFPSIPSPLVFTFPLHDPAPLPWGRCVSQDPGDRISFFRVVGLLRGATTPACMGVVLAVVVVVVIV